VRFLAADPAAAYITGQVFAGGWRMLDELNQPSIVSAVSSRRRRIRCSNFKPSAAHGHGPRNSPDRHVDPGHGQPKARDIKKAIGTGTRPRSRAIA